MCNNGFVNSPINNDFTNNFPRLWYSFSSKYKLSFNPTGLYGLSILSPKILVVKPNSKLSWQYHNRRAEICGVFRGEVGVSRSFDDNQNPLKKLIPGDQIKLKKVFIHYLKYLEIK